MSAGIAIDPHSDTFYQNPFPDYARLRAEAPVYEVPGEDGLFFVTTMELVKQALKDPALFSNSFPAARRTSPPPEVAEEIAALRAQGFPYAAALGVNDPPNHTRYRKMVNRAFTPRALAWMEPLVDSAADSLAEALPDGEVVDFVDAIARPLPIWAILRILGLPESRREDVRRWSEAATASLGGHMTGEQWVQAEHNILDYQQVMSQELDARRLAPSDDLLSALVDVEDGETPLTNAELVWLIRELIVAGNETTTRVLAELVVILDGRPELWDQMRDSADLRRAVGEEAIRMAAPATGMWRRVMRDTELNGVPIPEGSTVFLTFTSANRDEAVFEDGEEFQPDRANIRDHVAFGKGIHVCVGAGLARIELESMLRALSGRVTSLEVVDRDALRYGPSYALRGLMKVPVRVHRR